MVDEVEVSALYGVLVGILAQTPQHAAAWDSVNGVKRYNAVLERIKKAAPDDFSLFCIEWNPTVPSHDNEVLMKCQQQLDDFRQTVNGLIMYLYRKYFPTEEPPFGGPRPSSVNVNTNVSQSQEVSVHMKHAFEIAMDTKLSKLPEGSPEKQWWEKAKKSLATTNTLIGLVSNLIKLAKDSGLDINGLTKLFC
jgi:hypothetical protein